VTPNVALLKFTGSKQLTVEQVNKRRFEFLMTHGLNIISVQPEPGESSRTARTEEPPNENGGQSVPETVTTSTHRYVVLVSFI
jgi:hypothetical protein